MRSSADLSLERFRLQRLVVEFNEAYLAPDAERAEDVEAYHTDADFDLWEPQTEGDCMTMLCVDCYPEAETPTPRFKHVGVTVWGIFSCSPHVDQDQKNQLMQYNTVAILHGIARGLIASATGSCPGGPFLLPVVNYREVIERKLRESVTEQEPGNVEQPLEGLGDH